MPALARRFLVASAAVAICLVIAALPVQATSLVFHASLSGKQTLDNGEGGGNPFASAFVEALGAPNLTLGGLATAMQQLTAKKSLGYQTADVPGSLPSKSYPLRPQTRGERRVALVMVVSSYDSSQGAQSLPGARHDADRVTTALQKAGFATDKAVDLSLPDMRKKLAEFKARSAAADLAIVYTTGHGVEVEGTVYLLPGDYPISQKSPALPSRALPLPDIAGSLRARQINLVFYGGCRDNPFAP